MKEYYSYLSSLAKDKISQLTRKAAIVSWLRVIIFIAAIVGAYALSNWATAAGGLIIFLILVRYHDRLLRAKARQETLLQFAEARLRVGGGDLSGQPSGERHIDPMHHFSYDLDIFGENSLFSMLDSTATPIGADTLANWLKNPLLDSEQITLRQQAVAELSKLNSLRSEFHASGKTIEKESQANAPDFANIPSFRLPAALTALAYIAAPFFAAVLTLSILGIIAASSVVWTIILYLAIAALTSKRIGILHQWLCATVEALTARKELFMQIEKAEFSSALMTSLKGSLSCNGTDASQIISRLARLLKSLDQRYNAAGFILFNGTALWDIIVIDRVSRWMKKYSGKLPEWQKTLGEFDALSALGTFAFENPDYTYPNIDNDGKIILQAEEMGHPLILRTKRVDNPFNAMRQHSFAIVTGANMAGKSTYLRTVGNNLQMAMAGSPLAASHMVFTPSVLFTGLRANDSLANGESYFFAELKRLQAVVKEAEQGYPMFILLDEILRGTNSADKQRGSLALVRRLINLPVAGILATHDLALGALAGEFPENITAYCFEAEINGDKLSFDYKLRKGVANNLNAYFLMEKMGIV